ncbi:MAG: sodium:calcium antiporter [Thermoleophilaceae bacterium]
MHALLAVALLAVGVGVVVGGAELFFDGLLATAARLRVSPFVLTVVISGLELENLAAGIAANAKGLPGAAAGTFLGGTTFLALAVSSIGALIAPARRGLPGRALAWTALAPLPLVALASDGRLSRLDGGLLVAWFGVALAGMVRAAPAELADPAAARPRRFGVLRMAGGLALLGAGGAVLGDGLRRVVERIGVSDTVLGNTAVAAAVEAEEIGRPIAAARRGRGDLALANVTGTIVHFAALNAGVIALVRPLPLQGPSRWLHLPAASVATLLLALVVWRRGGLGRPEGLLLLTLYVAYVTAAIVAG